MGTLFEDYATDLYARTFAGHSSARFYREGAFTGSGRRPDGAVVEERTVVIVEMSTTTFTLDTMTTGDRGGFHAEVIGSSVERGKFASKIDQLANATEAIIDSRLGVRGANLASARHFLPVLLLLHPFPQSPLTTPNLMNVARIQGRLSRLSDRADIQVFPPQIVTMEEMEMLEPLICEYGASLARLLARRATTRGLALGSLKNAMLLGFGLDEKPNHHMLPLSSRTFEPKLTVAAWETLARV